MILTTLVLYPALRHSSMLIGSFIGLLLLPHWLVAQSDSEATPFTIEECIAFAVEHNRTVQNLRFDEYIAQKDVEELIATGLPQINGQVDLNYNFQLPVFVLPGENGELQDVTFGLPWQATAGANLQQLIFDGRFFLGVKASRIYVELSRLNTLRGVEQMVYDISRAYYSARLSQERLSTLNANINRVEKLYNETQALNEEGYAEKIDVERLEINLNNLNAELSSAQQLLSVSIDLLKYQMGMSVNEAIILTDDIETMEITPAPLTAKADFDYTQRIEYKLLQTQKTIEEFQLKSYRAGYLPNLYGIANYSWNRQWDSEEAFAFTTGATGLSLSIPIFDGGQKLKQVQRSKLKLRKINIDMDQLENGSKLEIREAIANLNNAFNSYEAQQKNRNLAQKVYDITRIKYKEGVGSSLEVNEAETQLQQAEANYLASLFEYLIAKLDLRKLNGEFRNYELP